MSFLGNLFGGGQQTTTSSSEPWKGAQPALTQGIAGAQNLYNSGVGQQVYTGSTVTPWSRQTMAGMNAISRDASHNMNGNGLSGEMQGIINSGGYNPAQQQALKYTLGVANSKFDINGDPAFKQVLDQTTNSVNSAASSMGRYGSGMHQGVLAQQVGDLGARQYQNWLNRRDTANTSAFGMGQQGFNNLGSAYQTMTAPSQDMFKIGAMNEDLATRQKNDELRIFDDSQSKPWDQLARYNAIVSGAGQLGRSVTETKPGENPFLSAIGGLSGGLGILGKMI